MKTVSYDRYGDREVLQLVEAPESEPKAGELRVRVQAASINPVDGKVRRGELKLIAGGHFPKRPGLDFAGVVESIGAGVTGFAVGDAVYGGGKSMSEGTLAEHIVVSAGAIAHLPRGLDAVTAAAVPVVAIAALQSLRDTVKVKAGDRVVVNGASGGVGWFAVQLARRMGAHVTAVCGPDGVPLVRALGADDVIDYRARPLSAAGGTFHALLELSGRLPFAEAHALLDEHGLYVDFSPSPASLIGNALANPFRGQKHVFVMSASKTADLEAIARMLDGDELRPPPVRVFPLAEFREAFDVAERGGLVGKVVVRIAD